MSANLETRVEVLERELRRTRALGAIILIGATSSLVIGAQQLQQGPEIVRARRIEVIDGSGVPRITLAVDVAGAAQVDVGDPTTSSLLLKCSPEESLIRVKSLDSAHERNSLAEVRCGAYGDGWTGERHATSADSFVRLLASRGPGDKPERENQASAELRSSVDWTGSQLPGRPPCKLYRDSKVENRLPASYDFSKQPLVVPRHLGFGSFGVSDFDGGSDGAFGLFDLSGGDGMATISAQDGNACCGFACEGFNHGQRLSMADAKDGPSISLRDDLGNLRAQLGCAELKAEETGVKTVMPIGSLVLFNETGKVIASFPSH